MKLRMAKNSMFGILLRSPWWVSAAVAAAFGATAWALLPTDWRVAGALSALPFVVIAAMAAWRRRHAPSAARVQETGQALRHMPWPAVADLLEQAFRRDGHTVARRHGAADFELERKDRRMLVAARRWKSAQTGLEPLRELQALREKAEADALYIGMGELSEAAAAFAAQHCIAVWQTPELAQVLRGLALPSPKGPR
jgi:restriction system protein